MFDNTLTFTTLARVDDQDPDILENPNIDDGDRNFDPGIISTRFDLLSELDIYYKRNMGVRGSFSAWYDPMYLRKNDNDSPETCNTISEKHDHFTDETEELHGLDVDLLDAFFFWRGKLANRRISFRVGRHTLLWGETLFMAGNGILSAQAPMDFAKALQVPSTQAKELFLPVGQFSGQIELARNLTLAAYYQFEWRRNRIPAAGSYFSDADMIEQGGESLIVPGGRFYRGHDLEADPNRQFGISMHYLPKGTGLDIGLYFINYNAHAEYWVYLDPTKGDPAHGNFGDYYLVYPENIKMVGISASGQIGLTNVAGELSARIDAPLASTPQVAIGPADNDDDNLYALGNTLHGNFSFIRFLQEKRLFGIKLWEGGNIMGEIGFEYLLDKTDNEEAFDPTRDDYAWGFRILFTPDWYQVFPGFDFHFPIGFAYNGDGASPSDVKFNNGGAVCGGDFSVGVDVDYHTTWKFGLKYTNYYGDTDFQTLGDRDFISFTFKHTF